MFSKELSVSLRRICESRKISYETAAELCDISSRHFGNVVREASCPTIATLEKLCTGLNQMPNDLLGFSSKQTAMPIEKVFHACLPEHLLVIPICPACDLPLDFMNQHHCCHCGQILSWEHFDDAQFIRLF